MNPNHTAEITMPPLVLENLELLRTGFNTGGYYLTSFQIIILTISARFANKKPSGLIWPASCICGVKHETMKPPWVIKYVRVWMMKVSASWFMLFHRKGKNKNELTMEAAREHWDDGVNLHRKNITGALFKITGKIYYLFALFYVHSHSTIFQTPQLCLLVLRLQPHLQRTRSVKWVQLRDRANPDKSWRSVE